MTLDIEKLREAMFAPDWPGYTPDGVDTGKRYSHVTVSRLLEYNGPHWSILMDTFYKMFRRAQWTHGQHGYPEDAPPSSDECCLRMLEYPPGVGGAAHTDFDMFTLNIWRSHPEKLWPHCGATHVGELAEIMQPGFRIATPHHVMASHEAQTSLVFFVLPSRDTKLPTGGTMGPWLDERKARARV